MTSVHAMHLSYSAGSSPPGGSTTWNPADKGAGVTLSNGDMTASIVNFDAVRSTTSFSSSKRYAELKWDTVTGSDTFVWGIATNTMNLSGFSVGFDTASASLTQDNKTYFGTGISATGSAAPTGNVGDVFGLAIDFDAFKAWYSVNGVYVGNPTAGTGPELTWGSALSLYLACSSNNFASMTLKTLGTTYGAPSGFLEWDA